MRISASPKHSDPKAKIGRRAAARLRLSIPGKLVTIYEKQRCVVVNLSRSGAQVSLAKPLAPGEAAFLELAGKEHFATVVWSDEGSNGLEFEIPLEDDQVLATRDFEDKLDELERRELHRIAREWITGGIR